MPFIQFVDVRTFLEQQRKRLRFMRAALIAPIVGVSSEPLILNFVFHKGPIHGMVCQEDWRCVAFMGNCEMLP